jgi:hypothetical protein
MTPQNSAPDQRLPHAYQHRQQRQRHDARRRDAVSRATHRRRVPLTARMSRTTRGRPITSPSRTTTSTVIRRRVPRCVAAQIPGPDISQSVVRVKHGRVRSDITDIRAESSEVRVAFDQIGAVEVLKRCVEERLGSCEILVVVCIFCDPDRFVEAAHGLVSLLWL